MEIRADEDDELGEAEAVPAPAPNLLRNLVERFAAVGVNAQIKEDEFVIETEDGEREPIVESYIEAEIPCARKFRTVEIREGTHLATLAETAEIEFWRFIDGYEGIWSLESRTIECALVGAMPAGLTRLFRRVTEGAPAPEPGAVYRSLTTRPRRNNSRFALGLRATNFEYFPRRPSVGA